MQSLGAIRTNYVEYVLPHFKNNDFAITLTYPENDSQYSRKYVPQYDKASRDVKHFLNVINYKVYGRRYKNRKACLTSVNVFEHSANNGLHFHMILENPEDWKIPESEKMSLILDAWLSMKCSGYPTANDVDHVDKVESWVPYLFKKITPSNTLRCDVANWHLNVKINDQKN